MRTKQQRHTNHREMPASSSASRRSPVQRSVSGYPAARPAGSRPAAGIRPAAHPPANGNQPGSPRRYPAASTSALPRPASPGSMAGSGKSRAIQERYSTPWLPFAGLAAVFMVFLLLLPAALAGLYYGYYQVYERILPGVRVSGISLGGLSAEQAAQRLDQAWNTGRVLTLTDGVRSWQVYPHELGLWLDAPATAQAAFEWGHGQGFWDELNQLVISSQNGWEAAPVVRLDAVRARQGLETLAPQVNVPPINATLQLRGDQLVSLPAADGLSLNVEKTLQTLAVHPAGVLAGARMVLILEPVGAPVQDVSAARAEAERLLAATLTVRAYDPVSGENLTWQIPLTSAGGWLGIENTQTGPVVSVNNDQLSAYLDGQLAELNASLGPERWLDLEANRAETADYAQALLSGQPLTLIVRHAPTTYIVQTGDTLIKIGWKVGVPYWMLLQANPGLDEKALRSGQVLNVPSKDELLPLPVVPDKRILISISQQRMWVYQNGEQIWEFIISTGIDRSPTQPGIFQIRTHEVSAYASIWDLTMPHFMGIYEAWPGFINGIHGLPTLSNGRRLWANILGSPASYGCIILDLDDAETLFNWAEAGVVVEIRA